MKLLESMDFLLAFQKELSEKIKEDGLTDIDITQIANIHLGLVYIITEHLKKKLIKIQIDNMTDNTNPPEDIP